ncbi:MAG: hypothetical protein ACXABJ_05000 [Candidatus Heimdallarchaeaceae archaeon]
MKRNTKISRWNFFIVFIILVLSIPLSQKSSAFQEQTNFGFFTLDGGDFHSWNWTMTEVLSTAGINTGTSPALSIDGSGNVYIAWDYYTGGATPTDIYLRIWNTTSLSWSTPELVTTASASHASSPSLFIDSFNNLHVVWNDGSDIAGAGTDDDIFYRFWNSTSLSWSPYELVSSNSNVTSRTPSLAVDLNGNVHVSWTNYTDFAGGDYDVVYNFRNATDNIWNTTEEISVGSSDYSGYSTISTDSAGSVHITWRDDEPNYAGSGASSDVFYRFWNSTSLNWDAIEAVSFESTYYCYDPFSTVDSAGNVHVVWQDGSNYAGSGNDYDVFYKLKNATSLSWTLPEVVSTESDDSIGSPKLAIDSQNNVHVTWSESADYLSSGTDMDFFYKFKNASSLNWNITEVVTTESFDHSQDANLFADLHGNVHFTWMDNTNYASAGTDFDIFYKRLGLTYLRSTILNPISPNPSTTGDVTLNWQTVQFASKYYVYRSDSSISSTVGLTPITVSSTTSYEDTSLINDIYYYVIVAATPYINGSMSNEALVEVDVVIIPELSIILQSSLGLMIGTALLAIVIRRKKKH